MPTDPEGRLLLIAALGAGMAHELRNVLAAAESSLYLAARLDDPAVRAKHVDAARGHVRTAQGLVDRALAPTRGIDVVGESVSIAALWTRAAEVARLGEQATLSVDIDGELELVCDELLVERALVNLVENAASAAERPVHIHVGARRDSAGGVRLEVRDDGPGIPEAVKARLFEPLATARPGGTGLGLPLVRAIVEAHGGRVEVTTSAAGTAIALLFAGPS